MFQVPDRCTEWTGRHGMADTPTPRSTLEWFSIKVCAQYYIINLSDKQTCILYSSYYWYTKTYMVVYNIMSYNTVAEDNVQSPGPAAYLPCYPNLKRAPTPKLLLPLTDSEMRNIGPSPNAYTLRSEHQSSIKSRRKGYTM